MRIYKIRYPDGTWQGKNSVTDDPTRAKIWSRLGHAKMAFSDNAEAILEIEATETIIRTISAKDLIKEREDKKRAKEIRQKIEWAKYNRERNIKEFLRIKKELESYGISTGTL